jgi:AraC-like DNA-binding protein
MVTVCALIPPAERSRIEAVGSGCFVTLYAGSFREVLAAARRARVDAVVFSAHSCAADDLPAVMRLVREFPALPTVALVSRHDAVSTQTLLRLGASGVRAAIDCSMPDGWHRLRDTLGRPASPVTAQLLSRLRPALHDTSDDVRLFFETLARLAPVIPTVRGLSRHLAVRHSTLMSRFQRAGVPSPKAYLAGMRLLHIAWLLENPGISVADAAYRMDFSSPQSLGRHLKAMLGLTAGEFRRRFPFEVALTRYVDLLVTPYREALRAVHPFHAGQRDQGPHAAAASRAG